MTERRSIGLPPGRVLAAWWRQLAPWQPSHLWLIDWVIGEYDVLARSSRPTPLDPFHRLFLGLLQIRTTTALALAAHLDLDVALVAQSLGELGALGLAELSAGGIWSATDSGLSAVEREHVPNRRWERRAFAIRVSPPAFVPVHLPSQRIENADSLLAPLSELRSAVNRTKEWKVAAGFPADVDEIGELDSSSVRESPSSWRRVPVVRTSRLCAVLIRGNEGLVHGFEINTHSWNLGQLPCAKFSSSYADELGLRDFDIDAWRSPWRKWCDSHGLGEAAGVDLKRDKHQLSAVLPTALFDRVLRRVPAIGQGEEWVSVDDSLHRSVCQLTIDSDHAESSQVDGSRNAT